MVFFYSALFPGCFFFGFAILFVQYYADKYCLMRIWGRSASIGSELAQFSRRYFFSGALLAYVLVSAYAWLQFPYDNLCDPDQPITGASGVYQYQAPDGTIIPTTVTQDTEVVFCQQSWLYLDRFPFPPTSALQPAGLTWMRGSQETLTDVYGWFSLAVLVFFIVFLFGAAITRFLFSWFRGVYSPAGQDQHIDFSSNSEMTAYVPQIKRGGFAFPMLACDVDQLDKVRCIVDREGNADPSLTSIFV